jgi:hypothetical protein
MELSCSFHVGACKVTAHPHLLVRAITERFLPTGGTFRVGLASESHWLQPLLVLTVSEWAIKPVRQVPKHMNSTMDVHWCTQYIVVKSFT